MPPRTPVSLLTKNLQGSGNQERTKYTDVSIELHLISYDESFLDDKRPCIEIRVRWEFTVVINFAREASLSKSSRRSTTA